VVDEEELRTSRTLLPFFRSTGMGMQFDASKSLGNTAQRFLYTTAVSAARLMRARAPSCAQRSHLTPRMCLLPTRRARSAWRIQQECVMESCSRNCHFLSTRVVKVSSSPNPSLNPSPNPCPYPKNPNPIPNPNKASLNTRRICSSREPS
jgi:hypothetical protein